MDTTAYAGEGFKGRAVNLRRPIVPPTVFSKKNSCPAQGLASLLHSQA